MKFGLHYQLPCYGSQSPVQRYRDTLEQSVHAASLTMRPGDEVSAVRLFNDLPVSGIDGGFMAELGDFYGGETRRLLLEIDVPAIQRLGLATV